MKFTDFFYEKSLPQLCYGVSLTFCMKWDRQIDRYIYLTNEILEDLLSDKAKNIFSERTCTSSYYLSTCFILPPCEFCCFLCWIMSFYIRRLRYNIFSVSRVSTSFCFVLGSRNKTALTVCLFKNNTLKSKFGRLRALRLTKLWIIVKLATLRPQLWMFHWLVLLAETKYCTFQR